MVQSSNKHRTATRYRQALFQQDMMPQSRGNTGSHRSAAVQMPSLDDPFQDQSSQMPDHFFDGNDEYNQGTITQQYGQGNQYVNMQSYGYPSQQGHPHSSYGAQAPYTQQVPQELSNDGQNPYAEEDSEDYEDYLRRREQARKDWDSSRIKIPEAVKNTPGYFMRMVRLEFTGNQDFLKKFITWDKQQQLDFVDWRDPTPAAKEKAFQEQLNHARVRRAEEAARVQNPAGFDIQSSPLPGGGTPAPPPPAVSPDRAPRTGFAAGDKKEMLIQHYENEAESSKARAERSDIPRTVMRDPGPHRSANRSTSTATTSTLKPQAPEFQPRRNLPPQPAQTQSASYQRDLLESSEALPSSHRANDFTSPINHSAPSTSQRSYEPALPWNYHIDAMTQIKRGHEPAPPWNYYIDGMAQMMRGHELVRHKDRMQQTQDNLQAGKSTHRGFGHREHLNAQKSAQNSTQSTTATGFPPSETSAQMLQAQYTATRQSVLHGSLAGFGTPYDTNSMGTRSHLPEPFASEAAHSDRLDFLAKKQLKDRKNLAEADAWFRATSSDKDRNLQTVTAELQAGSGLSYLPNTNSKSNAAGKAKLLPTPIGHERSAAAKRAAATTSIPSSNPMNNPTAQDGIDLMAGPITNLRGYANGSDIGGNFANWTRPAEHAIDKSPDGNKSVFDKNWGSPPARVGRDPRYQQTMTTDGRPTYLEVPARGGKSRQ